MSVGVRVALLLVFVALDKLGSGDSRLMDTDLELGGGSLELELEPEPEAKGS